MSTDNNFWNDFLFLEYFSLSELLNNRFLRKRGMASNLKMEYQVFLCIFQKNSAMATLDLNEMGEFLWEGREKGLSCWLSQFSFAIVLLNWDSQQSRPFSLPSQMNFPISFKPKVAWYYEKLVGRHASFPSRRSVKEVIFVLSIR